MRYSIAPVAFAAVAAALPQGVTEDITPSTSAPAGCSPDYQGTFQIQVVNTTESDMRKRQEDPASAGAVPLVLTLSGGILRDAQGRTGYIAANRQFQFDGPAQTGAIYTAGWSVCGDNALAIGGDKVFQQCLSGTFYNLYDEATEEQCSSVHIEAINGRAATGGQPAPAQVSQIADGQPQSPSAVQQIPDGQLQQPTGSPIQQIPDGQIQQPTGSPIQQIPDGQIQQPTGSPVQQIPDGQVQQPTGSPVQQIPDGQVQQPTGSPVQQIPDGQVQAPTGSPVSQIPDGQVQVPKNGSVASPTIQPYTGAGSSVQASLVSFVAAVGAAVFFL